MHGCIHKIKTHTGEDPESHKGQYGAWWQDTGVAIETSLGNTSCSTILLRKKHASSLNMARQRDAYERIWQKRSCRGIAEQVWRQTHHGRRLKFFTVPCAVRGAVPVCMFHLAISLDLKMSQSLRWFFLLQVLTPYQEIGEVSSGANDWKHTLQSSKATVGRTKMNGLYKTGYSWNCRVDDGYFLAASFFEEIAMSWNSSRRLDLKLCE